MIQFGVFLYNLLLHLLGPLVITLYFLRAKLRGRKVHIAERFWPPSLPPKRKPRIWLHGVSVGELLCLLPLYEELRSRRSDVEIVISTTTDAGMRTARSRFPEPVFFFPADFPSVVRAFLRRVKPDVVVVAETELWPNFIVQCWKMGVPLIVVNGRLSDRSFRRYRLVRFFMKGLLRKITLIAAQTQRYKERFLALGAEESRVVVTGNMKADYKIRVKEMSWEEIGLEEGEKVIVAGSTMSSQEEEYILEAYRKAGFCQRLVIAPRHLERVDELKELLQEKGFSFACRTERPSSWQVLILNTIGELAGLYSRASLAIIGGSIMPFGGHNLLEPAWFAVPIAFGPHMENFRDLASTFLAKGASLFFSSVDELADIIKGACAGKLEEAGKRAKEVLLSLQGASRRNAEIIEKFLP